MPSPLTRFTFLAAAFLSIATSATASISEHHPNDLEVWEQRLSQAWQTVPEDRQALLARLHVEQGLSELLDIVSVATSMGAMSEEGWFLDCDRSAQLIRGWTDTSYSLTRTYLAASLLESWTLACEQVDTTWTDEDAQRLVEATLRSANSPGWPAALTEVREVYRDRDAVQAMMDYVQERGSLSTYDRTCERAVVARVEAGEMTIAQALEDMTCRETPLYDVLEIPFPNERYTAQPLSKVFQSRFLGIQRLVPSPDVMLNWLESPQVRDSMSKILVEALRSPPIFDEHVQLIALDNERLTGVDFTDADHAYSVLMEQELTSYRDRFVSLLTQQSHIAQLCEDSTSASWETAMHEVRSLPGLHELLGMRVYKDLLCGEEGVALSPEDLRLIDEAFIRVADALPERWSSLASGLRDDHASIANVYLAQMQFQLPPERWACAQARIDDAWPEDMPFAHALMAIRARCLPVYDVSNEG